MDWRSNDRPKRRSSTCSHITANSLPSASSTCLMVPAMKGRGSSALDWVIEKSSQPVGSRPRDHRAALLAQSPDEHRDLRLSAYVRTFRPHGGQEELSSPGGPALGAARVLATTARKPPQAAWSCKCSGASLNSNGRCFANERAPAWRPLAIAV
jgi:hypothetical protein